MLVLNAFDRVVGSLSLRDAGGRHRREGHPGDLRGTLFAGTAHM